MKIKNFLSFLSKVKLYLYAFVFSMTIILDPFINTSIGFGLKL